MCIRATEAYHAYFGMPVGDQDERWASPVICKYCRHTLEDWLRGEKRTIGFVIPRIWREPFNHHSDCYFCMVDLLKRRKGKNAPPIKYPNILFSIAPVRHNTSDLPVPNPSTKAQQMVALESSEDSETEKREPSSSFDVRRRQRSRDERCPHYPNQEDINDLI